MANVDFDMTVQQTVINVTDQTGETFEVTPQPKVEVSVAEGTVGGSSGSGSAALEKFFGLPDALPKGYEAITNEEICSTIEEIMTSMDLELTQEMATSITQATLNEQ
jgi:hypothetical protein